jgi:hypothetical protein
MKFTDAVADVAGFTPPGGFSQVVESIEPAWIEEALAATGTASVRRRKLPAEAVVWLVIAMALFRDRSILAVLTHLGLAIDRESPDGRGTVVPGAIPKARSRVGDKPLEWLFNRTASTWADEAAGADRWRGCQGAPKRTAIGAGKRILIRAFVALARSRARRSRRMRA